MGNAHTPADNIFYDLVSIQYHALKGSQVYDQYLQDAAEHQDVRQFIEQCKQQDSQRAEQAHKLLGELTREYSGAMGG
ncbi:MAG TPA: hypothetical protein VF054_18660 [Micromonosporaceae bacterium]